MRALIALIVQSRLHRRSSLKFFPRGLTCPFRPPSQPALASQCGVGVLGLRSSKGRGTATDIAIPRHVSLARRGRTSRSAVRQTRRRATMDRPAAPAYLERGRNDGLNPLGAIELPEITDPRLRLLHDLWQKHRDG